MTGLQGTNKLKNECNCLGFSLRCDSEAAISTDGRDHSDATCHRTPDVSGKQRGDQEMQNI